MKKQAKSKYSTNIGLAEKIKAMQFTPVMPNGFVHTRYYGITHPNGRSCGALLLNKTTGIYVIYNTGVITNVPQGWARAHCEKTITEVE